MITTPEELGALRDNIVRWMDNDVDDPESDVHLYFGAQDERYWCDVSNSGSELMKDVLSPYEYSGVSFIVDAIISGVAAQAADGVVQTMSKALGLDPYIVSMLVDSANGAYQNDDTKALEGCSTVDEFLVEYHREAKIYADSIKADE